MIDKLLQRILAIEKALSRWNQMDAPTKTRLETVVPVSGELTIHSAYIAINGSGTVDTITAMNDGFLVTLRKTGSSVTVDTGGNLHLSASMTLDSDYDTITLRYDKALDAWLEVARSNNT